MSEDLKQPGPTPAELRVLAAELREEAARLREEAADRRRKAAALDGDADYAEEMAALKDGRAKSVEAEAAGLSREAKSVTNETVSTSGIVSPSRKRRPGAKPTPKGLVGRAVNVLDISIGDLAKRLGEKYDSVRTWKARGNLPDDVEKRILELIDEHQREQARLAKQSAKKTT